MCVDPLIINGVEVQCHKCWQCLEDRVDDIVGRCIAEQKVSTYTYTVTLTYGGDSRIDGRVPLKARLLDFQDVTKYIKRLRKFVPLRYVGAGEYGETKGRGHFHLVIFTNRTIPNLELYKRYLHEGPTIGGRKYAFWNDGYSYWEEATYQRMRYACAYVLKEIGAHKKNSERRFGASRFPPLGAEYFRQMAMKYVEQGLSPQDGFYTFREVKNKDGSLKRFRLTRRSSEHFRQRFIDAWMFVYGNSDWPQSDYIDEFIDAQAVALALRPGDWLAERRFEMKREASKWDGLKNAVVSVGMIAERKTRAADRLDDRLRTMGNRKGIGYEPFSPLPQATLPLFDTESGR